MVTSRKEESYEPIKRIIVEDNSENILNLKSIKKILKPSLSVLLNKINEVNVLTGGKKSITTDPITLLDEIINKLNTIPYIPWAVSFSTVDMIVLRIVNNKIQVLLGKKYKQTQWQFPGGFRDPGETNKQAASRELEEECRIKIEPERFKCFDDLFINDKRYENSPHKITTNVNIVFLTEEEAELTHGGDDLEMTQWFPLKDLMKDKTLIMRIVHHKLFDYVFNVNNFSTYLKSMKLKIKFK